MIGVNATDDTGAVLVLNYSSSDGWEQAQTILSSDLAYEDQFGESVALSRDSVRTPIPSLTHLCVLTFLPGCRSLLVLQTQRYQVLKRELSMCLRRHGRTLNFRSSQPAREVKALVAPSQPTKIWCPLSLLSRSQDF